MRFLTILVPMLSLASASAAAAGCRETLRPLLLQTPPDPVAVRAAHALCTGEAASGDSDAVYRSALLHLGLLDWDVAAAIPMMRTAARRGVPEAQYWLAWQYEEGPLLPDDRRLALRWYRQAAANEHRLALDRLAVAYRRGELGLDAEARKAVEMRARAERCRN